MCTDPRDRRGSVTEVSPRLFVSTTGTQNVLDACLANGVTSLLYTSTQDVVMDVNISGLVDETAPYAQNFIFGEYARTKCKAEQMILKADSTKLENGTLCI